MTISVTQTGDIIASQLRVLYGYNIHLMCANKVYTSSALDRIIEPIRIETSRVESVLT